MITVQAIKNINGKPIRGLKVYIVAGGVRVAYTNANGEAMINFPLPSKGKVVIDRQTVHEGTLQAYMKFYL
ncbi:hypothetical protein [Nodularia chucula]|uniref:hypothetical protein n=1 Tax=Nodularia chucula TaxID=3093667 RepID=UPI0039C76382